MIKVSVIVPVYNVEEYIERCLKSLVNQTLKDIEILVINDGSPDNSEDIILKYAKKYSNIKYLKKENGGLSDARNYGLKHAKGEYIAFVDSDDYVDKNMFKEMYNKAKKDSLDLTICSLDCVDDDENYLMSVNCYLNKNIYKEDIKKYMLDFYPSAWNKLYKRELFNNKVEFKKGVWYEDVEFIYRLIPYVNSIGFVNKELYHYVQREGAITKTFDKRLYNYIDNWNGIIDFYKNKKLYDEYKKELEYCYVRYLYATFVKQATNYNDKAEYNDAVDAAIKNVRSTFPKYRRNSYFYRNLKGFYLVCFNKLVSKLIYVVYRRK